MTKHSNSQSNGEVFGAQALSLATIGASVLIMLGVLWQPAPAHVTVAKASAPIEQVVSKVPAGHPAAG